MAERITAVNGIAREKRKINPRLSPRAYLAATASSKLPATFAERRQAAHARGLPLPGDLRVQPQTTSRQLVKEQLEAFQDNWAKVDLAYAKSKNLTPYDVLIIASMIEKEVVAPRSGALVAAVIYNRLQRMPLGIDATTRYGLDVPGTEPLHEVAAQRATNPYNTRKPITGAAADADREPGPRVDAGGRASRRRSTTCTSSASPTSSTTSSRRATPTSTRSPASTATAVG